MSGQRASAPGSPPLPADGPPPPEIIEVEETRVACDGGGGALGHPRIYLNLRNGRAECGYCDRLFVLKPGATPKDGH